MVVNSLIHKNKVSPPTPSSYDTLHEQIVYHLNLYNQSLMYIPLIPSRLCSLSYLCSQISSVFFCYLLLKARFLHERLLVVPSFPRVWARGRCSPSTLHDITGDICHATMLLWHVSCFPMFGSFGTHRGPAPVRGKASLVFLFNLNGDGYDSYSPLLP